MAWDLVQLFPVAAADFGRWLLRGLCEELRAPLLAAEAGSAEDALFALFAPYAISNFARQIQAYRCLAMNWHLAPASETCCSAQHDPVKASCLCSTCPHAIRANTAMCCGPPEEFFDP